MHLQPSSSSLFRLATRTTLQGQRPGSSTAATLRVPISTSTFASRLALTRPPVHARHIRLTTGYTATTSTSTSSSSRTRTMSTSTSAAPLQEWLVIAPDFEGALEKRLAVRPDHIGGLKKDVETFWLWGGAMLEEPVKEGETPKMKGSAMLIGASTREEVVERLKRDVYVTGGVWDWEKVQIIPFKSALRKAL